MKLENILKKIKEKQKQIDRKLDFLLDKFLKAEEEKELPVINIQDNKNDL